MLHMQNWFLWQCHFKSKNNTLPKKTTETALSAGFGGKKTDPRNIQKG